MARRFRGRPFCDFVQHHADGMSVDHLKHTLAGFINVLPKQLHAEIAEWLQINVPHGSMETVMKTDCGDVFLAVVDRSRVFATKYSVEPENETLVNLFQIVALNFGIITSKKPKAPAFSLFGGIL
jgi:hypothetical protein